MKKLLVIILLSMPIVLSAQSNGLDYYNKMKLFQVSTGLTIGVVSDASLSFTKMDNFNRHMTSFAIVSAYGIGLEIFNHKQIGTWSITNFTNTIIGGLMSMALMELKDFAITRKQNKTLML